MKTVKLAPRRRMFALGTASALAIAAASPALFVAAGLAGAGGAVAPAGAAAADPTATPSIDDNVQVANVINHIRTNFGNDYRDPITAAEVRSLHPAQGKPE